jgi:peroxiredoxin
MPSLTEQLAEMLANFPDSDEGRALRLRAIAEVARSGEAPGLAVGERIPDFVLPDAFGHQVSSRALLQSGPSVISFYRGEWCPYCNVELRALELASDQIRALGGSIVAISGQRADHALSLTQKHSLSFPVLSDLDQTVIRAFRLRYTVPAELRAMFEGRGQDISQQNADGSWTLPISATYVTDHTGTIVLAHAEAEWRMRLDPTDIIEALTKLEGQVAPGRR